MYLLIPNKCDVMFNKPEDREVMREHADMFAKENKLIYIDECSALADINIKESIMELVEKIYIV